jgi:hypothetical protein
MINLILRHGIVKYIEDNFEPIQRALHIYQEDKKLKKIKC